MDEAKKLWCTEQRSHTSNNLSALSYLAIATGVSGKLESGTSYSGRLQDLAQEMGVFGVLPTNQLVSTFHSLSADKIKSLAFATWGAYAWLTLVVLAVVESLRLTVTVTVVFTTQRSQSHLQQYFPFLEILTERHIMEFV